MQEYDDSFEEDSDENKTSEITETKTDETESKTDETEDDTDNTEDDVEDVFHGNGHSTDLPDHFLTNDRTPNNMEDSIDESKNNIEPDFHNEDGRHLYTTSMEYKQYETTRSKSIENYESDTRSSNDKQLEPNVINNSYSDYAAKPIIENGATSSPSMRRPKTSKGFVNFNKINSEKHKINNVSNTAGILKTTICRTF